jgi:hypothetical protein
VVYQGLMNIGDLTKKAEQFLDTEKGEKLSDQALEKAAQFAEERTGGKHDAQIEKAEQFADEHVGRRDADPR